MALQPLDRPIDSTQVLRYRGPITVGGPGDTAATYPKPNAEIPFDSAVVGNVVTAWVRFALFDPGFTSPPAVPADVANPQRRFPAFVYDDSNLAAISPHAPVPSVASPTPGINVSDLSIEARTWAENLHVEVQALDGTLLFVDTGDVRVLLDSGKDSGLGLNTGLPVIALKFSSTGDGEGAPVQFDVDVYIEIRHSEIR